MTYAELQRRMSNTEFELWMALSMVQSEECPACGRWAGEMMEVASKPVKCPFCKHEYNRFVTLEKGD